MICNLDCFNCGYGDCINDNPKPIDTERIYHNHRQLENEEKT